MGTQLKASLRVEIPGSATLAAVHTIEAEAYDRIAVALPKETNGAKPVTVEVQPGNTGQVKLLLLTASVYGEVTYMVDDRKSSISLDAPQLFVGTGAVRLLGAVKELHFTNNGTAEVQVQILVGRDATPAPP